MSVPIWSLSVKHRLGSLDQLVMVYHDHHDVMLLDHPDGCEADIGVRLSKPFDRDSVLTCVMTPSGLAAHARHHGPYSVLPEIHANMRAWCIEQNRPITGLFWEHYAVWHEEPARLVTDIYFLLGDDAPSSR